MADRRASLVQTVQHNCHIVDAHHARSYSMCIYLLKMREYYRWEKGLGFQARLPKQLLGDWLVERESLWETLEDDSFLPVEIDGICYSPFESDAINQALRGHGLVYSGGLSSGSQPHFFLAHSLSDEQHQGSRIVITGHELARELSAPPAMSQGSTIHVRRESLQRMLWERLEEWQWNQGNTPMANAVAAYPFDSDFQRALDAMTDMETHTVVQHELGEQEAGRRLGPDWGEMLLRLGRSRADLALRAARDHLADALVTLPHLLDGERNPSLHFYFANFNGMRRELYPQLLEYYGQWRDGSLSEERFAGLVEEGKQRWEAQLEAAIRAHRNTENNDDLHRAVETLFSLH